jgi:polyisoprenoid-binding protein YceI
VAFFLVASRTVSGYHLDGQNTLVSFSISRFGLHWLTARFRDLSGEFVLDTDGRGGSLSVDVRMDSIDCRDASWNDHLRSPEWLDTRQFPRMTYKSTRIEMGRAGHARVVGDLTLHGVSRPVVLNISDIDCDASGSAEERTCRFSGRAQLRRSEFGIPHGFWQGGDTVEIFLRGN